MRSVNKVMLIGYLATDPELKTTTTGKSVTVFKLATNRDWKTSDGEHHQATDYHRVTAWNKLGEICNQHLRKGSGIYVEGRISNHKYQGKDGMDHNLTEVVADNINFLSFHRSKERQEVNLVEVPAAV